MATLLLYSLFSLFCNSILRRDSVWRLLFLSLIFNPECRILTVFVYLSYFSLNFLLAVLKLFAVIAFCKQSKDELHSANSSRTNYILQTVQKWVAFCKQSELKKKYTQEKKKSEDAKGTIYTEIWGKYIEVRTRIVEV